VAARGFARAEARSAPAAARARPRASGRGPRTWDREWGSPGARGPAHASCAGPALGAAADASGKRERDAVAV